MSHYRKASIDPRDDLLLKPMYQKISVCDLQDILTYIVLFLNPVQLSFHCPSGLSYGSCK